MCGANEIPGQVWLWKAWPGAWAADAGIDLVAEDHDGGLWVIQAANKHLARIHIESISDRVSPHLLRRTYASLRAAAGNHPVYIAEQLGHEDPGLTFRVYQRAVKRRDRLDGAYREAFDAALGWAGNPPRTAQTPTVASRGGRSASKP